MEDTLRSGAFRAEVAAVLGVWRPDLTLIMPDDPDTIVVDTPTTEYRIFLGNLHANVRALSGDARRDAILDFLINAVSGSVLDRGEPAWPEAKGRLWVQIVPVVYGSQIPTLVSRPFTPRVLIAYALVSDDTYKLVTQEMLQRWDVAADVVHDAAVAGLEAASEALPITVKDAAERGPGAYAIMVSGDSFDAARLVLPGFVGRLRAALGGTAIVGIPIRDVLIAWTPDCFARAHFASLVNEDSKPGAHSHPLTNELFVVTAAGVRPAAAADPAPGSAPPEPDASRVRLGGPGPRNAMARRGLTNVGRQAGTCRPAAVSDTAAGRPHRSHFQAILEAHRPWSGPARPGPFSLASLGFGAPGWSNRYCASFSSFSFGPQSPRLPARSSRPSTGPAAWPSRPSPAAAWTQA